ncbi:AMP-binding protein [Rhodococcus rhodochrous]|uniref:class I adenylate-forming enzyme family protein n=1 Tax=Rhodococcus rhodochrous TaxID=1829 RepID=UPI001E3F69A6|nr:AMP-binding protein [Rhodococcus rhodochrous]MCB8913097.1 AMP-binding protein [Rhodococcus rhodochrous]
MTEPSSRAVPAVGPGQIIPYAATRYPDKIALINDETSLTYRQLDRMSDSVAAALRARGIGTGAVCSLYGQNSWQWIVTYHGILKAGAVANPINVMLTGPELAFVLADCSSQVLFAGALQAATVEAIRTEIPGVEVVYRFDDAETNAGPEDGSVPFAELLAVGADTAPVVSNPGARDLCSIAYTSGTTGHPKGAMQSHESVLLNCALTATMHGRNADDIVVTALPAAHVYGNVAINSTFLAGGTVILMKRFDASAALRLIERHHATMFEGVPAMYSMMTGHSDFDTTDLSSLRASTIGGQTFAPALIDRWQGRAPGPVLELWGMTELSGLGTTHAVFAPPSLGSIGVSLPGLDVRIGPLDGTEEQVPSGEHGELQVRGPLVMLGYHGRPDATAEALTTDGWLRTGDVAYADDTGHFFIVDRLKDMIVTAGYNVYPAEIERVIGSHPEVELVAVGGLPDPVKGEIAVAYVVLAAGSTLSEPDVLEYCRDYLAAYKRPRKVIFVDSLPTTSSGKLMRRKLAELKVDAFDSEVVLPGQ